MSVVAKRLRILVADDHEVVRRGVRALLESQPGWEVSGEACDGREAVEKARSLRPDILVLDVSMPGMNGLEVTREVVAALPEVRVLILTMHESQHFLNEALDAGAHGYLLKSDAGRDLVTAVETLRARRLFFTPRAPFEVRPLR